MRCMHTHFSVSHVFDPASAADTPRASTYPRVQFTVIINPNSGPGECALPDDSYTEAIRRLNSMDNVRTIGYVATTWCTRSLGSVLDDITLYAEWGNFDPSLAMTGIFFDETPTSYTPEHVSYLQTISQTVRSNHGLTDGFVGKTYSFISALGVFEAPAGPEAGGSRYMDHPSYITCSSPQYCGFAVPKSRNRGSCYRQL